MSNTVKLYVCGYDKCDFSSNLKKSVIDHAVNHVEDKPVVIEPSSYYCEICKFYAKYTNPNKHIKASHENKDR